MISTNTLESLALSYFYSLKTCNTMDSDIDDFVDSYIKCSRSCLYFMKMRNINPKALYSYSDLDYDNSLNTCDDYFRSTAITIHNSEKIKDTTLMHHEINDAAMSVLTKCELEKVSVIIKTLEKLYDDMDMHKNDIDDVDNEIIINI